MKTQARILGYALLRVATGMVFFIFGLQKFLGGHGKFVEGTVAEFAKTPLPPFSVRLFADVLPFCELIFGTLLVLGLFTVATLFLTGLLLLGLNFGVLWLGDAGILANNMTYVIAVFLLLYFSEFNGLSVDGLRTRPAKRP